MITFVMIMAVLMYGLGFGYLVRHALKHTTPQPFSAQTLMASGIVLHGMVLRHDMFSAQGIDYDVFNLISFTALFMLTISVMMSVRKAVLFLNILALPIAIAALLLGHICSRDGHQINAHGTVLNIHVILSLSAYAVLFMATIHAVVMALQHQELKNKLRHRLWVRLLPPLQVMQQLLFELLLLGFGLLTAALLIGFLSIDDFFAQHLAHKTVFSLLSWCIYAVLLFGHWRFGWRGSKMIRFTMLAFGLLALGFIGSKFVLEIMLQRI